ncbi:MAG: adenosylcobalamin-dependent ribonucleoside-diphosphate reductase [Desulfobacter sp.]|uniref:adenosylcobalamin-dependent ribonucleoside-diphosphate reductase n=1 Tax=Desulfobacter sp. TaxID=2294 RepID=UPI001B778CB9|nr:adenosylcobalamin-dependent ribonucleoside-diphosphate reductase [Desulfobacter sp.]MBP8829583.1 adenosylcobalamin-dependent ribonucleoside-diphosphate reductase [Desulfobacter sp.]
MENTHMEKECPTLSALAWTVIKNRYLARNCRGDLIERPADMFHRVAESVARADRLFDTGADLSKTTERFEAVLASLAFLPNSPCLMNAGTALGQLAACFVLPVEDRPEAMCQTMKEATIIHEACGGIGFSFSRLRPRGDTILQACGEAEGPVAFIRQLDTAAGRTNQNRRRPAANMAVLEISHPDIEAFINAKQTRGELRHFNLSVAVDDQFMECLNSGRDYPLVHPGTGKVVGRRNAEEIFERMASSAWQTGDPGLLFIDRINRDNPLPGMGRICATNPCGEQPLLPYESCTLGSINLTKVVENKEINFDELDRLARTAVHFLDNVIEINHYPLRQIEEASRSTRKIGLGVMGFADMLILLNIPYQSDRAVAVAGRIMSRIQRSAEAESASLALVRGNFPCFDHSIFPKRGLRLRRNATLTTVAPTGSISLIAGVSSGIEPVFAFRGRRRINGILYDDIHPIYARYQKDQKPIPKEVFQSAWDVAPEWHLKVQAAFQRHTDNAVSKTVNLPGSATREDVRQVFLNAHAMGLKGITIYRDTSHGDQVLNTCTVNREDCG